MSPESIDLRKALHSSSSIDRSPMRSLGQGGKNNLKSSNANSENKTDNNNNNQSTGTPDTDILQRNTDGINDMESYRLLLQNLAKEQAELLSRGNSQNLEFQEKGNKKTAEVVDKKHLDAFLHQYQNMLGQFEDNAPELKLNQPIENNYHSNSTTSPNRNKVRKSVILDNPCDTCRDSQKMCVMVPDLLNCVRCETKGAKCDLPIRSSSEPDRKRTIENQNINQESKKIKGTSTVDNSLSHSFMNYLKYFSNDASPDDRNVMNNRASQTSENSTGDTSNVIPNSNNISTGVSASTSNLPSFQTSNFQNKGKYEAQQQPNIQYPRSSFFVGSTSVYDLALVDSIQLDKIDQVQLSGNLALRKVAPTVQFLIKDDHDPYFQERQELDIDNVEKLVHPHGKVLISIFFKLVHPYIPILHESVFLEKYSRSYRELTAPLLASVYSLASQWWDFHPSLIGFSKPDIINELNSIAYRSFFDLVDKPKLSSVQTGLLLLQTRGENSNNWVLCSTIVALAEDLGLGVDCQDWKLPKWERGLRRRLAWTVWMHEKWNALLEGRYSHLALGRNWMVRPLADSDLPSESLVINNPSLLDSGIYGSTISNMSLFDMSPTHNDFMEGNSMFKYMISLSVILSEIMNTFYSQGTEQITNIEEVLKLAKPLQLKLREWYRLLPSNLLMTNFKKGKFNANASLALSYFAAELTLHRKIISSLNQDTSNELVNVCRTAAKSRLVAVIDFVHDLKNEHINAFWYTPSTGSLMLIATFSTMLFVTAPNKEESQLYRDYLRKYVWMLKVGSKSFDMERNALQKIHMLLAQIPDLLTDSQPKTCVPNLSALQVAYSQQYSPMENTVSNDSQLTQSQLNQLKSLPYELLQNLISFQNNSVNSLSQSLLDSQTPSGDNESFKEKGDQGLLYSKVLFNKSTSNIEQDSNSEKKKLVNAVLPVQRIPIYRGDRSSRIINDTPLTNKVVTPQSYGGSHSSKDKNIIDTSGERINQETSNSDHKSSPRGLFPSKTAEYNQPTNNNQRNSPANEISNQSS